MTNHEPFSDEEARSVTAVWQGLGLPGLIDVHTHFMPRNVMDKVWAYFDSVGPMVGREWPINYRADEDVRVAGLAAFGVRRFTSMIYPHKPNMGEWLNGWAADFATRHRDCLQTSTFYPEESAPAYVGKAIESGARVFKSHIQVGDYSPTDPLLDGVWAQLADAQIPVVIHCGSGPAPGRFTGPRPIADVLHRFPSLRLIIAHMGTPEFVEFLDLADRYPSVLLDTTMSFTDFSEELVPFPNDAYPRLVDLGDRILFGSDYPNIPYGYRHALDALVRLEFGDDWLRGVLYANAARVFGVES
ncbi:amidohydrolase family protein [Gordonia sp. CPCC 205333]